jgi:hypothetical protein
MKLSRMRLTVRTLMVAVAILALTLAAFEAGRRTERSRTGRLAEALRQDLIENGSPAVDLLINDTLPQLSRRPR